jgi:hypothetical protein
MSRLDQDGPDAFNTIGLVANIVQLVDFSRKIFSKSRQIYSSSARALPTNADIATVTQDLNALTSKLRSSTAIITLPQNDPLEALCTRCENVGEELLAILEKLKIQGKTSRWKSVRKALKSVLSKEEIDEFKARLDDLRSEISLHVTINLR